MMDGAGALLRSHQMEPPPPFLAISVTVATLAAGVFAIYFYAPSWRVRRVPGPMAYPLIGHLPLLAKHGPAVFTVLRERFGPMYR